jgi:hypothetical protein
MLEYCTFFLFAEVINSLDPVRMRISISTV